MSIPPVLAMPGGRAVGHLKRVGGRGLLALLAAAVIMLVSVLGALLPDATLPLTWYVPVLDSAMLVTLAVVLFLSSSDVIIRRHGRLLPLAFVSVVLGMVWLQHMLTFPGVAPFTLPLVTNQTLYTHEATSLAEARAIAAILNSTIVNALAVITAERAKDFHYRYFGRTIGRIPLPLDALTRDLRDAYGVSQVEEQRLASFLARRLGKTADV